MNEADAGRRSGARVVDPLEEAFGRWDADRRRRMAPVPEPGIIRRVVGFFGRTARRANDLALGGELQRDLFRELIDRQAGLERRLEQLIDLETAVAALKTSEANILGALEAMWTLHAQHQAAAGSAGAADSGELANLRDRHEILRVRQTRVEGAVADLREELAAWRGGRSEPPLPLTPRDVAEILKTVDTSARPAQAVEISFQDARAEDLLLAAHRHFGGRFSSSGSSYRGPNDLWIHVDFSSHWNRPVLLENAAARLTAAGRFVLVTAPAAAGAPPAREGMILEEDREVSLTAGGAVRVSTWRKL